MQSESAASKFPIRADLHRILRERIIQGELSPGVRIREAHLAEELGTSRTPLREALIYLEQEGFVRSELAHGFSVEPLSGREVREIYPILWTLEGLALRSCETAVFSLLPELSRINAALAEASQPIERLQWDATWHETLISSSPNQRLLKMLSGLRLSIRRYEHLFMSDSDLVVESVRQHGQIIEALHNKDIDLALQFLTENWRVSRDLILVRLGEP